MMRMSIAAGLLASIVAGRSPVLAWGEAGRPAPAGQPAPAAPTPEPVPAAAPPAAEPAPDPALYKEWYFKAGEETRGPYAIGPMRDLVKAGVVVAETLTYVERNGWRPAREHPELADAFPAAQAAAPAPPPPPASPSQADLDQKMLNFFLGTWHAEAAGQFQNGDAYRAVSDVAYLPNGIARGVVTYTVPQTGFASSMGLQGTYTVRAAGDLFILSTDLLATGAAASDKITGTFRIIDQNTIENTVSGGRATRVK